MNKPISKYEQNLDAKDRREQWMEQRWPELCIEMAAAAVGEIGGGGTDGIKAGIADMLADNEALAERVYDAEEQADAAISRMEDR